MIIYIKKIYNTITQMHTINVSYKNNKSNIGNIELQTINKYDSCNEIRTNNNITYQHPQPISNDNFNDNIIIRMNEVIIQPNIDRLKKRLFLLFFCVVLLYYVVIIFILAICHKDFIIF